VGEGRERERKGRRVVEEDRGEMGGGRWEV
jgi:hypothetical protein